jgi:hypothetical protein
MTPQELAREKQEQAIESLTQPELTALILAAKILQSPAGLESMRIEQRLLNDEYLTLLRTEQANRAALRADLDLTVPDKVLTVTAEELEDPLPALAPASLRLLPPGSDL